jgi:regulator of protease activity HflC (stomatin/prohibitin superfamily)
MYKYRGLINRLSNNQLINNQLINKSRKFLTFVPPNTTGVKQTFGRLGGIFSDVSNLKPGLRIYVPVIQQINICDNKYIQESFIISCRTKDAVSAQLTVAVKWHIQPMDSSKALFSLNNPVEQIKALVSDSTRSSVSQLSIDELFAQSNTIPNIITDGLKIMSNHGFTIVNTLISSIHPDSHVVTSMNKVNASVREKEAKINDAHAEASRIIIEAQAKRDQMALIGEGVALQRENIFKGYGNSVDKTAQLLQIHPEKLLNFFQELQKLDTMKDIGNSTNTKTIFIPYNATNNNSTDIKPSITLMETH